MIRSTLDRSNHLELEALLDTVTSSLELPRAKLPLVLLLHEREPVDMRRFPKLIQRMCSQAVELPSLYAAADAFVRLGPDITGSEL